MSAIEALANREYKYGFVTNIEAETVPRGLNEEIIRTISAKKNEPEWMLEWRLKAYRHWLTMEEPEWANVHYPKVDYQDIIYYSAPKPKEKKASLDEVDPELLKTYEKLGIPLQERELLAGYDRVAADDEAPFALPRLRPPTEARDLAAVAVARRLPVALGDLADTCAHRGDQRRADRVGDLLALQVGEEVLAPEALVGAEKQPRADGKATQALVQETGRAGRGGGVPVAKLGVQPLARLADEAQQRVPADLAGVAAARPLKCVVRAQWRPG